MAEVTWYQEAEALQNLICEAYTSTSPSIIKELQQELEGFKPKFLKLLDDPPKNVDHRAELQKGNFFFFISEKGEEQCGKTGGGWCAFTTCLEMSEIRATYFVEFL